MLKKELSENSNGCCITISTEDTFLTIAYGYNWHDYQWNIFSINEEKIASDLSKENYGCWKSNAILISTEDELYPCFLELYENVATGKSIKYDDGVTIEYYDKQVHEDLFDADSQTITWFTDEYRPDNIDNNFQIIKNNDGIEVVFNYVHKAVVRVSKSGSRHNEYYVPFTKLFSDLRAKLQNTEKVKTKNI